MKTKKLLFLSVILMMLNFVPAVAQRGTCDATANQYYIVGSTQTNDVGTSSANAVVPTVPIGATVKVGINNGGVYLDNGPISTFTIAISKDGVFQSQIVKGVGSYGQGWQPTIPAAYFTSGAVVTAVMTVTPGSTFIGCSTPWTYTYTFNTSSVCVPNAARTFYYNNNIGSGWVNPATVVSGNITIPGLISLGSGPGVGANIKVGINSLLSGSTVTYSDGLGWTATGSGDKTYYPNFAYNAVAPETRTITATVTSNCVGTADQVVTFTITSANTCTPSTPVFYYNNQMGSGWVDPSTPDVSNNITVPGLFSPGAGTIFTAGIRLNGGTVAWSDGLGFTSTASGDVSYYPNFTAGETRVLTAAYTNTCGGTTNYTFTLTAAAVCVPAAYTPYYNNGTTGWINAADASPINLNAEVGNTVTLGINPNITALWTDGIALNQTNAQFDYIPAFTGEGQTRDVTATFTDNCGNAKSYTFHITSVISKTTWDGSAWSYSTPPSSTIEAIIAGTYSTTANGAFTAKKLTVNSGKSLTINTGTNVTVENEVINNGSLVVENNANLIQVNTVSNTGAITVNRNSNALYRLDYTIWSSPVAIQNLLAFSPLTTATRFYSYDNTASAFGSYSAISNPSLTAFAIGGGYLIRMPNEDPSNLGPGSTYALGSTTLTYNGVFTGTPNNGNASVTLNYGVDAAHAYNLVGNPYPSVIDANIFITANTANIESTLYFWRKTNGLGTAYAAYNPLGGVLTYASTTSEVPNGKIQVGQGFFVQAKSAITVPAFFTNAMRDVSPTSTQFFKTKKVVQQDRVWLNLTNTTGVFSQALIGYTDDATQGVDIYDGKYINDSSIALTSNINNEEYTIQGRPAFDSSDVVALNFKTDVAGDYTIAIDHADGLFAIGQDIYLVDNANGSETDLKAGAYTFAAAVGTDNSRFSLKYQKTLKVDAPAFNENSVAVYKNKGTLYVNSGAVAIANIKVFDIQGRLIAEQKNVKSNTATMTNLKATQQVLIVKVTGQDNSVVSKKVLN